MATRRDECFSYAGHAANAVDEALSDSVAE